MIPAKDATNGHIIKYRPDIDGLRALAILPVILFHARLTCPGGFVGVDVFFVISGYLITSMICQELSDGTFSLVNFWERRIRRILPALTAVGLATFAAAYFLFVPEDFTAVAKSVAALAVLGSNFYFWKQPAGYFATNLDNKPLLHTWSLGVEEQFYLLFPLLLFFLTRTRKSSLFKTILGLLMVSFVLSVIGTHMPKNLKTTYYLLPTRAWELMVGALLVWLRGKISSAAVLREAAGWLGLVLIGWPVFGYSDDTLFPGLAALPPCLGAALVIFSSESKLSSAGQVLALPPLVFVGLISYSLYLWHWPVLMCAAYLCQDKPGTGMQLELLVASVLLALLTWQFIEKPFRRRQIFQHRRQIFAFAGVSMSTLLALGLLAASQQGFPGRFPPQVVTYTSTHTHNPYLEDETFPEEAARLAHMIKFGATPTNPPLDLLVWGDSHAMALNPVLDKLCRDHGWRDMDATRPGTPPIIGEIGFQGLGEAPRDFRESVFNFVTQNRPRIVIMAARWTWYRNNESFRSNLLVTVHAVLGLGVRVYVVKDVPDPGFNVPRFAALSAMHGKDINLLGLARETYEKKNRLLDPVFDQIAHLGATVLDPGPYFLNRLGRYGVEKDGQILYYDSNHLSFEGSLMLAPLFDPVFRSQ